MKKGYRKKLEQTFLKFSLQTFPKQNPTMRKKYFFFKQNGKYKIFSYNSKHKKGCLQKIKFGRRMKDIKNNFMEFYFYAYKILLKFKSTLIEIKEIY